MAQLVVRNLEDEVKAKLRRRAAAHGRSMEEEVRAILRDGAEAGAFSVDDTGLTAMALIQMMTGVIVWFRPGERLSLAEVTATYLSMTMRLVGATMTYSIARPHGRAKDAVEV